MKKESSINKTNSVVLFTINKKTNEIQSVVMQ